MPDYSAPAFGNPNISRQGDKGRKNLARTYEDTWLDELLKGMFGSEEPSGSVLDPQRVEKAAANDAGQKLGVLTNLVPSKATLSGLAGLGAMGAIRLRGAKDLIMSHASGNPAGVARSGYLDSPSFGIHSRAPNDYSSANPLFIPRAGTVGPEIQSGTLINRDGYFANPSGRNKYDTLDTAYDHGQLADQVAEYERQALQNYGLKDTRLTQLWPGKSQGLSIGASPAFSSLKEFEKSPYGAQLLRGKAFDRQPAWNKLESDLFPLTQFDAQNIIAKYHRGEPLTQYEAELLTKASRLPSAMAEFKMHDKLDLNPEDMMILAPSLTGTADLAKFRDAGFQIRAPQHFFGPYTPKGYDEAWKRIPNAVTNKGEFVLPPALNPAGGTRYEKEVWNNFIEPKAGGSPPLRAADGSPGWLQNVKDKAAAKSVGNPPSITDMFQPAQTEPVFTSLNATAKANGVSPFDQFKEWKSTGLLKPSVEKALLFKIIEQEPNYLNASNFIHSLHLNQDDFADAIIHLQKVNP